MSALHHDPALPFHRTLASEYAARRAKLWSQPLLIALPSHKPALLPIIQVDSTSCKRTALPQEWRTPSVCPLAGNVQEAIHAALDWLEERDERVTMVLVLRAFAAVSAYSIADLIGRDRWHPLVHFRQAAMLTAWVLTGASLPAIGRAFGNRDHTTALHAIRKFRATPIPPGG